MPLSAQERERRKMEYARKALKAIHGYYSEYAAIPPYSDIADRMGVYARSWAYECVRRLIASGHLVKVPGGRLAPGDRFFDEL